MPELVSLCKAPKDGYMGMAEAGAAVCARGGLKVFHASFYAGCYIGFGAQLSMKIAGSTAHMAKDDPGITAFVFAALFPVLLFLILMTGGLLYTGVTAVVPMAVLEGKAHWINIPKYFVISWLGNLAGCLLFACCIQFCDLSTDVADLMFDFNTDSVKYSPAELTGRLAKKIAEAKVKGDFFPMFVKGIGCNWLVCAAIFMVGQAQDMAGKMVGIWFPISCFVAIGFEHVPANFFIITLGMLAGADVTVAEVIWKNYIPVTLGNTFAGSIIFACGYSYAYGALGQPRKPSEQKTSELADTPSTKV